ncbi:MAG: DUF6883 domain-containing protein [Phycisphaerales bacterium]
MKLPNAEHAIVDDRKIADYLLSPTHPVGRHKCAYFQSFGFSQANPAEFGGALVRHAIDNTVHETELTPFGTKHTVEGPLTTPDSRNPTIRTVWMMITPPAVSNRTPVPRLITAYPIPARS